jgi:hypothetical protein
VNDDKDWFLDLLNLEEPTPDTALEMARYRWGHAEVVK